MGRPKLSDYRSEISVKEKLLISAAKLFKEKGYYATSVREIVSMANVTKPVMYYYFKNKEGIYLELMQNAFKEFDAVIDISSKENISVKEKIEKLMLNIYDLLINSLDIAKLIYSIYYGPPQGAPFFDFDSHHEKLRNKIKDLVLQGIKKGEFANIDSEEMMWSIVGIVSVMVESNISHPTFCVSKKNIKGMLDILFKGISKKVK